MSYCHICLEETKNKEMYHEKCIKHFFEKQELPSLDLTKKEMQSLAIEMVKHRLAVPGVQKKMSLGFQQTKNSGTPRLTLMNFDSSYILKPSADQYPELPANEHLTMTLAKKLGIITADAALIQMEDELAYLTKRFDREHGEKIHMEDMAQLTETMTEHKYRGSMEKIGKIIKEYSRFPGNDLYRFFELTLFTFFSGNADMHLKNFSLLHSKKGVTLSPAYDLVNTAVLIKDDKEEMALSINGKKNKLSWSDFEVLGKSLQLSNKVIRNILRGFVDKDELVKKTIENSFLSPTYKSEYQNLWNSRVGRLKP